MKRVIACSIEEYQHTCTYTYMHTVFPRNFATARFYFKDQFGAVTIQGWLDFKGSIQGDRQVHAYVHRFNDEPVFMYNVRAKTYIIAGDPLPCGKISRKYCSIYTNFLPHGTLDYR